MNEQKHELTQQQARKLGLPDADPVNGEPVVWAPMPAQARVTKSNERTEIIRSLLFETAGAILGGEAA